MSDSYIYGLEDPRTNLIRYVGKSVDPQVRFKSHLRNNGDTYCARWIRTLKRAGLAPVLVILEGPCEDWEEIERKWIAFFGAQLTNLTSGGDGIHDLVRTPEHCAAIGRANKLREYTAEMRANMSKGQKERFLASGGMPPEVIAKQRLARKGKKWPQPMSVKGRANIAVARTGKKDSLEARANKSAAQLERYNGSNGSTERQKTANYGEKNGRYGKPYTAPRTSCLKCQRSVAVHALPGHLKACRELELAKELLRLELANGPQPIRIVMTKAEEIGLQAKTIHKAVKELDVQRLGLHRLTGHRLYALP